MAIPVGSPLYAVVDDIVNAAGSPDPLARTRAVLGEHTNRLHTLGVLAHEEEDDEVLLHASRNLTIYHITLSPGLQYPPHNHLMDALIGIYKGGETNFIYPDAASKLDAPQRRDSTAPTVLHLSPHTVHSVANTGNARSGALHVYLGNLPATHRQLWDLQSNQAEPFDNDRYLAGAQPIEQS
ncbi:autotransporter [Mesorhizobium sp. LjRoot246]|uniref:autotransporter n=1 Tax=Mesorhizobium sp. LjRoot246 TaxID=3342294 RepID=UPI003ECEA377